MNPVSYLDLGFDQFLSRVPENSSNSISSLAFEGFTDNLSGSKVQGGIMSTNDGQTELNLEQGFFRTIQADIQLVRFGRQDDGEIGILINDQQGNQLIKFTGGTNVLSSPEGDVELDFNEGQFEVKDDQDRTVVLLGKQVGGF